MNKWLRLTMLEWNHDKAVAVILKDDWNLVSRVIRSVVLNLLMRVNDMRLVKKSWSMDLLKLSIELKTDWKGLKFDYEVTWFCSWLMIRYLSILEIF